MTRTEQDRTEAEAARARFWGAVSTHSSSERDMGDTAAKALGEYRARRKVIGGRK